MAETAVHLCDSVFPQNVPVRQWVLSLPYPLRVRLGYDAALVRAVLGVWVRVLSGDYRRRAKRAGLSRIHGTGAVTVIQRASQALKLDPHFHSLVLDGVYVHRDDGSLEFRALAPPTEKEVARVSEVVARLLTRRGMDADASDSEQPDDALTSEEPALSTMAVASVQGVVATGRRRGCFVMRMGMANPSPVASLRRGLCAEAAGFNVHAGVRVAGRDRKGLERLCRYIARGVKVAIKSDRQEDRLVSKVLERGEGARR